MSIYNIEQWCRQTLDVVALVLTTIEGVVKFGYRSPSLACHIDLTCYANGGVCLECCNILCKANQILLGYDNVLHARICRMGELLELTNKTGLDRFCRTIKSHRHLLGRIGCVESYRYHTVITGRNSDIDIGGLVST